MAIKNFEAWLLANNQTVSKILGVELEQLENLEDSSDTKSILDKAIAESTYFSEESISLKKVVINVHSTFQVTKSALCRISADLGIQASTQKLICNCTAQSLVLALKAVSEGT